MPGVDGIELVRRVRELDASLPIIVVTAHATLDKAVEGIRAGATDFLTKPVKVDTVLALIERAIAERPFRDELASSIERQARRAAEEYVIGSHPRLEETRQFARRLARLPMARVLITGETGTGKSLLARAIHDQSGATGRFVEVNCAALPSSLLESELFGHEKGAFTDAKSLKRGLIEQAHHGTLLLDEIGAMPLDVQAKLLLFLERHDIRRVGGIQPIAIQTRVIAATNEDLRQRVRDRAFRADLFYRLDVASLEMPALRDMPSVILELAEHFVRQSSAESHRPLPHLRDSSFTSLLGYHWPGNARELRNAVERALIFYESGPFEVRPPAAGDLPPLDQSGLFVEFGLPLHEVETRYIAATLEMNRDRELGDLAQRLGISRQTLWKFRRRDKA